MIHSFPIVKPALLIGEINFLMNFPVLETLEFKDISESKKIPRRVVTPLANFCRSGLKEQLDLHKEPERVAKTAGVEEVAGVSETYVTEKTTRVAERDIVRDIHWSFRNSQS